MPNDAESNDADHPDDGWRRYSYWVDPDGDATANKVLRLVGHDKNVLELGCGPGMITRFMHEHYRCRVTAIEIDAVLAEYAKPFCQQLLIGDLDDFDFALAFADRRFDVVVAADVLEHLVDPWRCLKRVRGLLGPGGYLVASVPNVAHSALIAQLLAGRFPYQDKGLLDHSHLRFFARADLHEMLHACGYRAEVWERHLVEPEKTEFAEAWLGLAPAWREALVALPEARTYQFIVKALAPAASTA